MLDPLQGKLVLAGAEQELGATLEPRQWYGKALGRWSPVYCCHWEALANSFSSSIIWYGRETLFPKWILESVSTMSVFQVNITKEQQHSSLQTFCSRQLAWAQPKILCLPLLVCKIVSQRECWKLPQKSHLTQDWRKYIMNNRRQSLFCQGMG